MTTEFPTFDDGEDDLETTDGEVDEGGVDHAVMYPPDDSETENMVDEFVECFNARDLDGLRALLSPDVQLEALSAAGVDAAVEALGDLFFREPSIMLTRGEIENEPIAAVWQPGEGRYVGVGYLSFLLTEVDGRLIERIEYVDEIDESLVEAPDSSEISEWEVTGEEWDALGGGEHV